MSRKPCASNELYRFNVSRVAAAVRLRELEYDENRA
jgi:hypothetical protein